MQLIKSLRSVHAAQRLLNSELLNTPVDVYVQHLEVRGQLKDTRWGVLKGCNNGRHGTERPLHTI